ncbi:hypothetical protein EDD80_12510 [Anseongella ginsenosidimutans]|uniref:Uncharacterized protein n=1 Tax=Anseongella ginsenosidimutans TaxID=496056 RepID=A0A4V2UT34_9SPHI|nr:hypothetical protein [Anseongella ginsenosidimutans]QEC53623.1 hypothetical protein FRZ59_15620 [Anseongella ginsenosidimutans]TCS83919.1 hypothetical protein EDD80_12510 [Anseongella ginsenosidimutans]
MTKKHALESVHNYIKPEITTSLPYITETVGIEAAISAINHINYGGWSGHTYQPSIAPSSIVAPEFEREALIGKWINNSLPGFHGSSVSALNLKETRSFENALGTNDITGLGYVTSNRIGIYEQPVDVTGYLHGSSIAQSQFYSQGIGIDQALVQQPDATRLGANIASSQIYHTPDRLGLISKYDSLRPFDTSTSSLIHGMPDGQFLASKAYPFWQDIASAPLRLGEKDNNSLVIERSALVAHHSIEMAQNYSWISPVEDHPFSAIGREKTFGAARISAPSKYYDGSESLVLYTEKKQEELAQKITCRLGKFLDQRGLKTSNITCSCMYDKGVTVNLSVQVTQVVINASNIDGEIIQIGAENSIVYVNN